MWAFLKDEWVTFVKSNPGCQGCGADVTDSQAPLWDLQDILYATVLENVTHILSCCAQESDSIDMAWSGLVISWSMEQVVSRGACRGAGAAGGACSWLGQIRLASVQGSQSTQQQKDLVQHLNDLHTDCLSFLS